MINLTEFYNALIDNEITNFSGVPDSLLKDICFYIADKASPRNHLITANEGSAIALAAGQYLSSGKPSLVYMQNSGLGNAINPLLSLADQEVYGVPMLVLVGWRGEPGKKDEPQHLKQGKVTEELLKSCNLPYSIIDAKTTDIYERIGSFVKKAKENKSPFFILVKKNTFEKYLLNKVQEVDNNISREGALSLLVSLSTHNEIFVSTTGMISRELYEIREYQNQSHSNDFYTVGSMGHASMIALGISQNIRQKVICIDGDGSSLMHLGNFTSLGLSNRKNLIHIILNNSCHDSVGGQPTAAKHVNLYKLAENCGYKSYAKLEEKSEIEEVFKELLISDGPHFLEILVKKGHRDDLGRPTTSPQENKKKLMGSLGLIYDF